MSRRAPGAVALLLVGLLCAGTAGAGAASATAAARPGTAEPTALEQESLQVEVLVTSITPQVLAPGEDLRVRATVRNTGTTAVAEPRVQVNLSSTPFISRYSLDRWRGADPTSTVGAALLTLDLPEPLAPGASVPVDLHVPASAIRLPTSSAAWGARGLAVQVTDRGDPGAGRIGLARSFALWFPDQEVTATRISILVPFAGPTIDVAGGWADELEISTRPGGRLASVLAATAGHREVTWVVDPWLVDASAAAGRSTQAWSGEFLASMTDREVQLLPYADPDLAALAHAGAGELLAAAIDRSHRTATETDLPEGARVGLAWPADPLPDQSTATLAAHDRSRSLVVGPGELLAPAVLTYTPSGRTEVTLSGTEVTVLVPDERLSAALVSGQVQPFDESLAARTAVTPATAAQDLLAELAVITRERPADGRHMLLTVPRDWSPDAEVADAQLSAILAAPWVRAEPVTALIGSVDPEIDRGTLPVRRVAGTEVSPAALDTVRNAVALREALATIAANPASVLGDGELELLALASVGWRDDPAGRAALVSASTATTEALRSGVSAEPGTAVNLVSTSGDLPVLVVNHLDHEVTVRVGLVPGDRRLVVDAEVPVTIPAQGQVSVAVPVHAVQSADLDVIVELRTPEGVLIDDSTHFPVRVRAEWESIGAAAIAALLGLFLVVGLIRTIRRGRASTRAEPQAQAGPDTLSPEADAAAVHEDDGATGTTTPEAAHTSASPEVQGTTTTEVDR